MANGLAESSPFTSGPEPWWAKAITRWGLGTVLALYLVYLLGGRIVGALDTLNANLLTHMQSQDTQKELLSAVCANTSKTVEERNFCLDITMRDQAAISAAAASHAVTASGGS